MVPGPRWATCRPVEAAKEEKQSLATKRGAREIDNPLIVRERGKARLVGGQSAGRAKREREQQLRLNRDSGEKALKVGET